MSVESSIDPARAAELLEAAAKEPPRFVQIKFSDRENSKVYTYRVEPDASVRVGQYTITRRNMSKVTIVAIDTAPVPNLALDKYDFVDPVALEGDGAEE
jgi:hypothetical protein